MTAIIFKRRLNFCTKEPYVITKGDMKSVSWNIGVINVCILLCQITPFTQTLGEFAAKPREKEMILSSWIRCINLSWKQQNGSGWS